ncbi:glycosyltransferase [Aeromonas schubertii]|nr:glycosyltransferase [Aeromonas schubertii]
MAAQLNYWLSLSAADRLQMGNRARHTVVAGYSVESRMSEILAVYLG